jgi:regulator of extracellular matrix RemA (YlzA/DUF370 family)
MKHADKPMETAPVPYLWPLGQGGLIDPDRLVAVGRYHSAPIHRAAKAAEKAHRLIDLTYGKACIWVLFMDSGHVVLCSDAVPLLVLDDPDFTHLIINHHGEN